MSRAEISLKQLLARDRILTVPGAYDALSARLAAQAGAEAVYMTGFGVAGSLGGVPDLGLIGADEMTARVRALNTAVHPTPLIADGDNGHGGVLNAERLARAYEQAGAQCIQIEDQVSPKRCGHMDGKEVVPLDEATAKIRAIAAARASKDFLIMARTDAAAVSGFDDALKRGEAFLKAGADILFIEAPRSLEELRRVAETFKGTPLVANMVEDGKTPYLAANELEKLGFKIALFPISALLAVGATLERVYRSIVATGAPDANAPRLSFGDYNARVGLPEMLERAKQYAAKP